MQEHPGETEKKTRKGHARPRNSQGLKVKYPSQPGMLIGHRKSRSYAQVSGYCIASISTCVGFDERSKHMPFST